ncbi:hypothetical protein BO71DRAFT_395095 [Aspergillus ellipticus CBS 707.79]|uniref:Uncharacterized protein n=1 Tax=Aspergillus ellipticus CBS 707.79 TaxID=1448320 RepID=A0A319F207_9EURO|nr:hypothetical protein BO71DRAFT_395095 [Aspergillus ellipticus CBS 707.79]
MASQFRDDLLESYSDAELIDHIRSSLASAPHSRAFNLSSKFIAKCFELSEIEDATKAAKVASQLGIRAPSVRRIALNPQEVSAFAITDRIEGATLDVIWTKLSWFTTIRLGLQLRRFVNILRSVTSPTAGSLATGECRSFWLEDRFGLPANSGPKEFTHFFRFWPDFTSMRRAMQIAGQISVPKIHRTRSISS